MNSTAVLVGLAVGFIVLVWRAPRWVAKGQQSGRWWARQMVDAVAAHHGFSTSGGVGVGTIDGRPVRVEAVKGRGGAPAVDLSVALNLPRGLGLIPLLEVQEPGLSIGDKQFDRRWRITGGPAMLALFSSEVRKVFGRLGHDRVSIEDGRLIVRVLSDGHGATEITVELSEALEAAKLVEAQRADVQGLMALGINDLVPAVRAAGMRTALALAMGDASALTALVPLVEALEPALRIEAAKAIGPEGVSILVDLAQTPTVRKGVRAAAFVAAVEHGANGLLLKGVPEMLIQMSSQSARTELLRACTKSGTPVSIEVLRRLTSDPVEDVRLAAAELLGVHPDTLAAASLLNRLRRDASSKVAGVAAKVSHIPPATSPNTMSSFEQQVSALLRAPPPRRSKPAGRTVKL